MFAVTISVIVLVICIALTIPIGVSLGVGTLVGIYISDMPFAFFTIKMFNSFDSFPLMAVPFFILAGEIMQQGKLASSLLHLCRTTCGHREGGLAHISVITALFYGALSGSAAATTAAVGGVMIPAMEKDRYPSDFSTAVNAAAGSLGVMIPPSMPLILYGAFGGVSITDLFIAGIIPGFVVAFAFLITNKLIVHRNGYGKIEPKCSSRERWKAFKAAGWAMGVPIVVLGCIYSGITTPTEAGAIAVIYALIVETFINKCMTFALFKRIFIAAMRTNSVIFLLIITANALGTFFEYHSLGHHVTQAMHSFTENPYVFWLIMLAFLLMIGCILDLSATMLIFAPLFVPLCISYGINPVQFGMFMLVSLCIGFVTPPVGTNLFVACGISGIDLLTLSKACIPYIVAMLIVVLMLAYIPWLSLCLL